MEVALKRRVGTEIKEIWVALIGKLGHCLSIIWRKCLKRQRYQLLGTTLPFMTTKRKPCSLMPFTTRLASKFLLFFFFIQW